MQVAFADEVSELVTIQPLADMFDHLAGGVGFYCHARGFMICTSTNFTLQNLMGFFEKGKRNFA
jgi:hypothetical protein